MVRALASALALALALTIAPAIHMWSCRVDVSSTRVGHMLCHVVCFCGACCDGWSVIDHPCKAYAMSCVVFFGVLCVGWSVIDHPGMILCPPLPTLCVHARWSLTDRPGMIYAMCGRWCSCCLACRAVGCRPPGQGTCYVMWRFLLCVLSRAVAYRPPGYDTCYACHCFDIVFMSGGRLSTIRV